MNKQLKFPECKGIRPPRPTLRTPAVAMRFAQLIIDDLDPTKDWYWTADSASDRMFEMQHVVVSGTGLRKVIKALLREYPKQCWGRDEIEEHYLSIFRKVADKVVSEAVDHWNKTYFGF